MGLRGVSLVWSAAWAKCGGGGGFGGERGVSRRQTSLIDGLVPGGHRVLGGSSGSRGRGGPEFESVAFAAGGEDVPGILGVVFNLLPQPGDVDVHGARCDVTHFLPDVLEDPLARDHRAAVIDEEAQEFHLLGGKIDGTAFPRKLHPTKVHRVVPKFDARDGSEGLLAHATQEHVDAREQLVGDEGFDEIIVRAGAQTFDAVTNLTLGG